MNRFEHAPAFDLLGSYFPSWLLCFGVGLIVTLLVHAMLVKIKWVRYLWPLPLVSPSLVCLVTFGAWLKFFA